MTDYFKQYPDNAGFFKEYGGSFIPPDLQEEMNKIKTIEGCQTRAISKHEQEAFVSPCSLLLSITLLGIYRAASSYGGIGAGLWAAVFWTFICSDMWLWANQPNIEVCINAAMVWAFALMLRADVKKVQPFSIEPVDTSGGGDSFRADIVYGLLMGWVDKQTIEFAAAITSEECEQLIAFRLDFVAQPRHGNRKCPRLDLLQAQVAQLSISAGIRVMKKRASNAD